MGNDNNNCGIKELKAALNECHKVEDDCYKQAGKQLKQVKKNIDDFTDNLERFRKSINAGDGIDSLIKAAVDGQLAKVQTEYFELYEEAQRQIINKHKQLDTFNITLFGKTKAGKSTLMEILTHGNGASIGGGGQRTTRDVRSYNWQGMKVTDVPGIEAFNGEQDDQIAFDAAKYADLIVFMITAGQPENKEAEWLVELKRQDKPLICLCNHKYSISDSRHLNYFLTKSDKIHHEMEHTELKSQFNKFIQDKLPNEHLDILVSHLQAKYYSQQPEYHEQRAALEQASQFAEVEGALVREVISNGVFYRKKCYQTLIDEPIYKQKQILDELCENSQRQVNLVADKIKTAERWWGNFNTREFGNLKDNIHTIICKVGNDICSFVENHDEDKNIKAKWAEYVSSVVDEKVKKYVESYYDKANNFAQEIYSDLSAEMTFVENYSFDTSKVKNVFNYRRLWGWTSSILGLGGAIVALFSGPAGLVCGIGGAVFSIFSFFTTSKEEKMRRKRQKLKEDLRDMLDKMEERLIENITADRNNNLNGKIYTPMSKKLNFLKNSLQNLVTAEKKLSEDYKEMHQKLSRQLIGDILQSDNRYAAIRKSIAAVERKPSLETKIIFDGTPDVNIEELRIYISNKLGCHEQVSVICN